MDIRKFRPGDRQHFRRGVQLHGAGAERDHRTVEREVAVGQAADVAGHLAFGTVHVEDRMGHVIRFPQKRRRQAVFDFEVGDLEIAAECAPDGFERHRTSALVERHADLRLADLAQVDAFGDGCTQDQALHVADLDRDRVEEGFRLNFVAELFQALGHQHGLLVDLLGNRLQALRAVEDAVHRGHDGEQNLRGADVRRRLFAADMLFAGLQRQAIGAVAAGIDRNADKTAGHGALVGILDGHVSGVRAAVADRNAEALRGTDGDVSAHLTRGLQQRQRQKVGSYGGKSAGLVQAGDQPGEVTHFAIGARILEDRAENVDRIEIGHRIADNDGPAERGGAGFDQGDGLRVAGLVDEEGGCLGLRLALA
ncbi:hypothetical protein D3C73_664850 [compost metagenome]